MIRAALFVFVTLMLTCVIPSAQAEATPELVAFYCDVPRELTYVNKFLSEGVLQFDRQTRAVEGGLYLDTIDAGYESELVNRGSHEVTGTMKVYLPGELSRTQTLVFTLKMENPDSKPIQLVFGLDDKLRSFARFGEVSYRANCRIK